MDARRLIEARELEQLSQGEKYTPWESDGPARFCKRRVISGYDGHYLRTDGPKSTRATAGGPCKIKGGK